MAVEPEMPESRLPVADDVERILQHGQALEVAVAMAAITKIQADIELLEFRLRSIIAEAEQADLISVVIGQQEEIIRDVDQA
ncbi:MULTISPECIES: hypothetical protein [Aphanothece]|uniref:hypothetical protein n=1 Tax=Aphanothece TaxID=1121 RepID=UPI00398F5E9A